MKEKTGNNYIWIGILILLLLITQFIPVVQFPSLRIYSSGVHLLNFGCSVLLIGIWSSKCYLRIMHKLIRSYTLGIAVCMLLFMLLYILRRSVGNEMESLSRLLWYLYYVPMLFIPYFALMGSLYLGHEADYRPNRLWQLWLIPTCILLLLILTNDLHQLVFAIAENWNDGGGYQHGIIYYITAVWIFATIFMTLRNIYRASRPLIEERIIPLPYIISLIAILYTIVYILYPPTQYYLPLTPVFCVFTGAMIEALIHHGLIPTNNSFDWCFEHSGMDMQILDDEGAVVYAPYDSTPLTQEQFLRLQASEAFVRDQKNELHLQRLHGGYVYYTQDISVIRQIIQETTEANWQLEESNRTLRKNIQIAEEHWHLEHGNQLFAKCFQDIQGTLSQMDALLDEVVGQSPEARRRTLGLINIYGVYIKRRSNLVILNDQHSEHAGGELVLCLKETIRNLRLYGVHTSYSLKELHDLNIEEAILVYDLLQALLVSYLSEIWYLYIMLADNETESICTFQLRADSLNSDASAWEHWESARLARFSAAITSEQDEEGLAVSLRLPKGGSLS